MLTCLLQVDILCVNRSTKLSEAPHCSSCEGSACESLFPVEIALWQSFMVAYMKGTSDPLENNYGSGMELCKCLYKHKYF